MPRKPKLPDDLHACADKAANDLMVVARALQQPFASFNHDMMAEVYIKLGYATGTILRLKDRL